MIYGSTHWPHIVVERGQARLRDDRGYTLRELSMAELNNLAVGATNAVADMRREAARKPALRHVPDCKCEEQAR